MRGAWIASLDAAQAPRGRTDEARLTADIALARGYGRNGYRRIMALLNEASWDVSVSRVARIWRREGMKVPGKQPKRRRLWLADGSCMRLRPERGGAAGPPQSKFTSLRAPVLCPDRLQCKA